MKRLGFGSGSKRWQISGSGSQCIVFGSTTPDGNSDQCQGSVNCWLVNNGGLFFNATAEIGQFFIVLPFSVQTQFKLLMVCLVFLYLPFLGYANCGTLSSHGLDTWLARKNTSSTGTAVTLLLQKTVMCTLCSIAEPDSQSKTNTVPLIRTGRYLRISSFFYKFIRTVNTYR